MRTDDYRFYGQLCLGFGILILVIGIFLPLLTMSLYTDIVGNTVFNIPYLVQGVALAVVGIVLLVSSQVLSREYRIRTKEQKQAIPPPPSSAILSKKYCRFCGSENKSDSMYCSKCGKPLE